MSIDGDKFNAGSDSLIPKVVTVFRHLLFTEPISHDQIKEKTAEHDVADDILGWFEKEKQQKDDKLIHDIRQEITQRLIIDGGATLKHNVSNISPAAVSSDRRLD
jgi:hypothetical protein